MNWKRYIALVVLAVMLPVAAGAEDAGSRTEVVDPTCAESGYTKIYHEDGSITIEPGEPAKGHSFGEWQTDEITGDRIRICSVCKLVEQEKSLTAALPRIDLDGSFEGMDKQERVKLQFRFREEGEDFSCIANTSWQGHSTLEESKKNYTVRLFLDEALTEKNRMELRPGWQTEHKYILKANYRDMSQCRNLACAEIWAQMAECREGVAERLKETSHYGAVDGFPVRVYHDGNFLGLYTLNLHKDDDLYNMRYGARDAIVICNRAGTAAGLFREEASFTAENWDEGDWEIEYYGTDGDNSWVKESFNELIRFVMTADDETFQNELGSYLDVDSAIDYLIFLYAMGLTESADKDLVLIRYEETPWIATVYDMEDAFGLKPDGSGLLEPETFLPEKDGNGWNTNTGSLLWDRLMNLFEDRIIRRYEELRRSVLTEENIRAQVENIVNTIPENLVEEDYALYPDRETVSGDREKILNYIHERLEKLDHAFPEGTK